MGLIRLLILAAVIYLVWSAIKALLPAASSRNSDDNDNNQAPQLMRKCEQCGVHVPADQAIVHQGHYFCCEAHKKDFIDHHDH